MKLSLDLNSNNAAFEDSGEFEVARILRDVADRIESGSTEGRLRDVNGNNVGSWFLEGDE